MGSFWREIISCILSSQLLLLIIKFTVETMRNKTKLAPVQWLSEKTDWENVKDPNFVYKSVDLYTKFKFGNIVASVGDFVLISNADSADPDTEEGCDAAQLVTLYESHDMDLADRYRARVLWFSKPGDLPASCLKHHIAFSEDELVEDHRPFQVDVSIETFFKKCNIIRAYTSDDVSEILQRNYTSENTFICRYRLSAISKRKFDLEPVMDDERRQWDLLKTPQSKKCTPNAKTPSSITKHIERLSISEKWSISNAGDTKMLLKRAIFTDKKEKQQDFNDIHSSKISINKKKLNTKEINTIISTELIETSDDELPTLIIRQKPKTLTPSKSIKIEKAATPKRVIENAESPRSRYKRKTSTVDDDDLIFDIPLRKPSRRSEKPVRYTETDSDFEKSPKKISKNTPKISNDIDSDDTPSKTRASTRSTRSSIIKPINYFEEELDTTPVKTVKETKISKNTPKSARKKLNCSSDDEIFDTPTKSTSVCKTPSKRVTRKVTNLTPSLHTRAHYVDTKEAPKSNNNLPGREQQLDEILSFIRNKILDASSGCMYISGVPGTGKTATVCKALQMLKNEQLPEFQLVEVNGMRIAEPRQAYVQIYKQLTGKTVAWEQACSLLEKRFTIAAPRRTPTVLLVDELDALCTKRQDVVYSIMEWAARDTARLSVIAVANTMDLPERALASRVASRLGLTRLTFPPYTHAQLQRIVAETLDTRNLSADAIQLIARKVAAVSGDARRAICLCSRAMELAGDNASGSAGLAAVEKALAEAAGGTAVRAVANAAPAERLILRAIAAEVERTGLEETNLARVLQTATALVSLEGRGHRSAKRIAAPAHNHALNICARLAAQSLIFLEQKPDETKLLLNVSVDDVHYATRCIG